MRSATTTLRNLQSKKPPIPPSSSASSTAIWCLSTLKAEVSAFPCWVLVLIRATDFSINEIFSWDNNNFLRSLTTLSNEGNISNGVLPWLSLMVTSAPAKMYGGLIHPNQAIKILNISYRQAMRVKFGRRQCWNNTSNYYRTIQLSSRMTHCKPRSATLFCHFRGVVY